MTMHPTALSSRTAGAGRPRPCRWRASALLAFTAAGMPRRCGAGKLESICRETRVAPGRRRPPPGRRDPAAAAMAPMDGVGSGRGMRRGHGRQPQASGAGADASLPHLCAPRSRSSRPIWRRCQAPKVPRSASAAPLERHRAGRHDVDCSRAGAADGLAVSLASAALAQLLLRDASGRGSPVDARATVRAELAIRGEVLYRAGRIAEADATVLKARWAARRSAARRRSLPAGAWRAATASAPAGEAQARSSGAGSVAAHMRGMVIGIQGYCGAAQGNASAAGLAAGLAREEGGAARRDAGSARSGRCRRAGATGRRCA